MQEAVWRADGIGFGLVAQSVELPKGRRCGAPVAGKSGTGACANVAAAWDAGCGAEGDGASQPCLRLPITAPCSRRDLDHEGRTLPGALAGVVDRAVGAGGVDGEAVVGRPHGENSQKSRERTEGSPQFHWKGEGWDSTPGFRRARSFGGAGYERPAGCNDEGGMRPGGGMEERSAGRPLLHHGSGAYGTTWSTRAGFCPVPSREL